MSDLKKSPLANCHAELGGKMVPFSGWEMPVRYQSIIAEHEAVRTAVGVFDISHMGQLYAEGEQAEAWLNRMLTNDVTALESGQGQYTFLLNEEGGVIDDLLVYRLDEGRYFLVVNAACLAEDWAWLNQHLEEGVELRNASEDMAGMAVQGPQVVDVFSRLFGGRTLPGRNGVEVFSHGGAELIVCRTGYTGEDGFEFFCSAKQGEQWWEEMVEAGAKPCGLGARDTLRLEKCFPLNGSDLTPQITPLEAGLGFFVKLKKGEFIGSQVLVEQKEAGLTKKLVSIESLERGAPPRAGYSVLSLEGEVLGELTSGALSPTLGKGIGMAYLPLSLTEVGTELFLEVRGKKVRAKIVKKPFVV